MSQTGPLTKNLNPQIFLHCRHKDLLSLLRDLNISLAQCLVDITVQKHVETAGFYLRSLEAKVLSRKREQHFYY